MYLHERQWFAILRQDCPIGGQTIPVLLVGHIEARSAQSCPRCELEVNGPEMLI